MKNHSSESLPSSIADFTQSKPFSVANIGLSGAQVRVYDDFVLKIQPLSEQSQNEVNFLRFLHGKVRAPQVLARATQNGTDFLLMSRLRGTMLCDEEYLQNPEKLFRTAAQALQMLWSISPENCKDFMTLDKKLRLAELRVCDNAVHFEHVNPDILGPRGRFTTAERLLQWLIDNKPQEEPAISHGDACLPNIIVVSGEPYVLDVPYGGVSDKFCDVALLLRSCRDNLEGGYGKFHCAFDENLFYKCLGIAADKEKTEYYVFLDELF